MRRAWLPHRPASRPKPRGAFVQLIYNNRGITSKRPGNITSRNRALLVASFLASYLHVALNLNLLSYSGELSKKKTQVNARCDAPVILSSFQNIQFRVSIHSYFDLTRFNVHRESQISWVLFFSSFFLFI